MTINVTQADIDYGVRRNMQSCPVAHAINRDYGFCEVDHDYVTIGYSEPNKLPNVASKFIRDFDAGKCVKPFSFELD